MGTDIHGAIEVKSPYGSDYDYAMDITSMVGRDYDAFGLLFGVRNYANFEPIAEGRGLPDNLSRQLKKEIEGWGIEHSMSYITLEEIEKINPETESVDLDERIHQYHKKGKTLKQTSKFSASSDITNEDIKKMRNGETIQKEHTYFKMEKIKIKDVLGKNWYALFDIMKKFKELGHKAEDIRMVVFFDN